MTNGRIKVTDRAYIKKRQGYMASNAPDEKKRQAIKELDAIYNGDRADHKAMNQIHACAADPIPTAD